MKQSNSFDGHDLIFIIGSPRSGTTWIQGMLSDLPGVGTGAESELFTYYIKTIYEKWNKQSNVDSLGSRGVTGLPFYLDSGEFDKIVGKFVYETIKRMKGKSKIFLEKTPSHALVVDLIHKLLPKARFIHIIRDGRDVVASLLAAKKSWGYDWAPASIRSASKMWIEHVTKADEKLKIITNDLWIRVNYEDLVENSVKELIRISKFVGSEVNIKTAYRIVQKHNIIKQRKNRLQLYSQSKEPAGFYRRGKVGGWKNEFNYHEKILLTIYLRKNLKKFGYM